MESFTQVNVQGDTPTVRAYHSSVEFNGRLYLVMGRTGVITHNDMYWTGDCQKWHKQTMSHDIDGKLIHPVYMAGVCRHNKKVYLFGGKDFSVNYNHVYETSDMIHWKRLKNAPWSARYGFVAVTFDGKIWVIGGYSSEHLNEVWWTKDGVNWNQEPNAPWAARRLYSSGLVFDNKIYIVGGRDNSTHYNDVWATSNGKKWERITGAAEFSERRINTVTQIGDRIVMVGGYLNDFFSDMWHSSTGKQWQLCSESIETGGIGGHTTNFFNKRLIVACGVDAVYRNDIYIGNDKLLGTK